MKRTLSLILAALLLASSAVSCGKTEPAETAISETDIGVTETKAPETQSPETSISETNAPETSSPAPDYAYDTTLITENGIAKSHIVLPDGASDFEKTAADELAYHIKLVSGAEVAVTNAVQADSLPIIIATPDSLAELEELFPEDLAWLRVVSEERENARTLHWCGDGFVVRAHEGKIYIFGATAVGAMNGVYDFIEENLDVIWIGSRVEDIIYDEMPTITAIKTDYREKTPFLLYGRNDAFGARNKLSQRLWAYGSDANVKQHVLSSPIYDPNITEYWDTNTAGTHLSANESGQVNFWSELTADTIAAAVIANLDSFSDAERPKYYNVCMQDVEPPRIYPEMKEPFEYAPGQFVNPSEGNTYLSTVYFTFINRIARKVAEKYPDIYINTLAYMWATESPKCEIEDNVVVWFCTYNEDVTQDDFSPRFAASYSDYSVATAEAHALQNWITEHPDTLMHIYSYYHCHYAAGWYERPIWYRIQNDFQYFVEEGMLAVYFCGSLNQNESIHNWQDKSYALQFTHQNRWDMNLLSNWIMHKLLWDPYEDVDALIKKFCDKVYGDASSYMQEYYDLLELGWKQGAELIPYEFNAEIKLHLCQAYYSQYFLDFDLDDGTYYLDAVKDVLTKAYEAADDKAKEFIRYPYELFQDWEKVLERLNNPNH